MASTHMYGRFVQGRTSLWELCVGLEVHAQVASRTKLFSASPAGTGLTAAPNSAVSLFDVSHPGVLPVLNEGCVAQAVRAGLALRGTIPHMTRWDRKHYAYADLPHGYQITQLDHPIVRGGFLLFDVPVRHSKTGVRTREVRPVACRISRVQLEMDSGKSIHDLAREGSVVDFNRAGSALLEVVGAPDLRSADEAGSFVRELAQLLRHVGAASARMEEGGLRVDVNVSVRRAGEDVNNIVSCSGSPVQPSSPRSALWSTLDGRYEWAQACIPPTRGQLQARARWPGIIPEPKPTDGFAWAFSDPAAASSSFASLGLASPPVPHGQVEAPSGFGPRVELKNLTGPRAVEAAVNHEAARQVALLESGQRVEQETRMFDAAAGTSTRLRSKEQALDYRFTPEPDVAPVVITERYFRSLLATVPPSREEVRSRLCVDYGLPEADAALLVSAASDADVAPWDTTGPRAGGDAVASGQTTVTASEASATAPISSAVVFFETAAAAAVEEVRLLGQQEPSIQPTAGQGQAAETGGPSPPSHSPKAHPELSRSVCSWLVGEMVGRLRAVAEAHGSSSSTIGGAVPAAAGQQTQGAEDDEDAAGASGAQSVSSLLSTSPVSPARLGQLVTLVHCGFTSGRSAKRVLGLMLGQVDKDVGTAVEGQGAGKGGKAALSTTPSTSTFTLAPPDPRAPLAIVDSLDLRQLNDEAAIEGLARAVIADPAMADSLAKWRAGQDRVAGAFVARVLEANGGRANPALTATVVKRLLGPQTDKKEGPGAPMGRKAKAKLAAEQAAAAGKGA